MFRPAFTGLFVSAYVYISKSICLHTLIKRRYMFRGECIYFYTCKDVRICVVGPVSLQTLAGLSERECQKLYMCMFMYVCMYVCRYVSICMYEFVYAPCTSTYTYIQIHINTPVRECLYVIDSEL